MHLATSLSTPTSELSIVRPSVLSFLGCGQTDMSHSSPHQCHQCLTTVDCQTASFWHSSLPLHCSVCLSPCPCPCPCQSSLSCLLTSLAAAVPSLALSPSWVSFSASMATIGMMVSTSCINRIWVLCLFGNQLMHQLVYGCIYRFLRILWVPLSIITYCLRIHAVFNLTSNIGRSINW